MEENLPLLMMIDSIPSTIICNITFALKACNNLLYLRGMYK